MMSKRAAAISLFVIAAALLSSVPRATADDKAEIEAIQKRIVAAIQHRDADAIVANFEHGDSLVIFDVVPPRQFTGWNAWKKDWTDALKGCASAPKMDISDLKIEVSGDLGFSHNIGHFACVDPKGSQQEMTWRATDCYRKQGGKWIIVHEHLSVPVNPASGKGDLNSNP